MNPSRPRSAYNGVGSIDYFHPPPSESHIEEYLRWFLKIEWKSLTIGFRPFKNGESSQELNAYPTGLQSFSPLEKPKTAKSR